MKIFNLFKMFQSKKSTTAYPVKYKQSLRVSYIVDTNIRYHSSDYITDNDERTKEVMNSIRKNIADINEQLIKGYKYININNDLIINRENFVCVQRLFEEV